LSSFKSLYFKLITDNFNIFDALIVQKLCDSFKGYKEVEIINQIYNKFNRLSQDLYNTGRIENALGRDVMASLDVRTAKTHARRIKFHEHGNEYECESSDLCFIVDYVLYKPDRKLLLSRTITFIQVKLGESNGCWRLQKNQLYFMRYWPPFFYGQQRYHLDVFGAYPDIGSFYHFIYKNKSFLDTVVMSGRYKKRYEVNSFALSTPMIEYALRQPIAPGSSDSVIYDRPLNMLRNGRGCAYFLWRILLQDLGLHSVDAEEFIKCLYPGLFDIDPEEDQKAEEEPSVGIRVTVSLKVVG
jgi:hypothetical protein